MAAGDVYRLQQFFQVGSQITENVIHFKEVESETDEPAAFHLISAWHEKLGPLYNVELFGTSAVCYAMQARRILPAPGIPAFIAFGGAEFALIQGGAAGVLVPAQAAALIALYTNHAGPSGRGRNYWPGVDTAAQADGKLVDDRFAELEALAAAMVEEIGAGG